MASWRVPLTLMGLALAILACATIATADPDPPHVDGPRARHGPVGNNGQDAMVGQVRADRLNHVRIGAQ